MDTYSMDGYSTTSCGLQTISLNSVVARVTHHHSRCMALAGSDAALAVH